LHDQGAESGASAGVVLELVSVQTGDGVELDGAYYRPAQGNSREGRAFLLVHGMRWNFYRGPSRWIAPMLAGRGYDCLALNLRDHDSTEPQSLDDAFHDLRAGVDRLLREDGEVIPFAHGYGCTKVIGYAARSGDSRVGRHVLTTLGAVRRSHPSIWKGALQAGHAMPGQTLVVQGAADDRLDARPSADDLAAAAPNTRLELVLLDGANHYFDNRHSELIDCVTAWEVRTRGSSRHRATSAYRLLHTGQGCGSQRAETGMCSAESRCSRCRGCGRCSLGLLRGARLRRGPPRPAVTRPARIRR